MSSRAALPAASRRALPWEELAVFFVVVAGLLLLRPATPYAVGGYNDDGVYTVLGKALASGAGYRSIFMPGSPVQLKYPPGLPLVLSVFWRLTGSLSSVLALELLLNALLAGLAASMLWRFGRRVLEVPAPLVAAFAVTPFFLEPMLQYYSIILTEPWLIAGWALALVASARQLDGEGPASAVLPLAVILGITTMFRSHALALVLAAAIAIALRRRRALAVALFVVVGFAPEIAWTLFRMHLAAVGPVSHSPDDLTYLDWASHTNLGLGALLLDAVRTNVAYYAKLLAHLLSPLAALGAVALAIVAVLAGLGANRLLRSRPFLPLSVAGFLLLTLIWPYSQDRLLLPALPFLGLLVAQGAEGLWALGATRPPLMRRALAAFVVALVAMVSVQQIRMQAYVHQWPGGAKHRRPLTQPATMLYFNTRYIIQAAAWARRYTAPNAILLADYPSGIYLYSGRRTMNAEPTQTRFAPSIFRVPGRYLAERVLRDSVTVIIDAGSKPWLAFDEGAVHEHCPDAIRKVLKPLPVLIPPNIHVPVYLVGTDLACLRRTFLPPDSGASPVARSRSSGS